MLLCISMLRQSASFISFEMVFLFSLLLSDIDFVNTSLFFAGTNWWTGYYKLDLPLIARPRFILGTVSSSDASYVM